MKKDYKNKLSLNGEWIYIKDADNKYIFKDIESLLHKSELTKKINLPLNWELGGLHNFNGTVWFIKQFNFPITNEELKLLKFLGVDYFADVWLNKNYLGNHEGYFSPFSFDVTGLIKEENNLVVKVTSPFEIPGEVWPDRKKLIKGIFNHHDCRPGSTSKKFGQDQNTGGIWNDVFIESGYKISIENIKVTSSFEPSSEIASLLIQINYYSIEKVEKNGKLDFQITHPSGAQFKLKKDFNFKPGNNDIIHSIDINSPELWWSWDLGEPKAYRLKISSNFFNSVEMKFGIRQVYLDSNQQFFINGKKLFLRGTNIIPTQFLSGLSNDKIAKIVSLVKEANINIIRVHAHVNREEFYDECDRQGILVWQDFSLQWTYDESTNFRDNAVTQIKEMVNLLYNHPAIVFWCCHNEPGEQINSLDPFLEEAVYSIDKTRIVRRASNYEEHAYDGWYWGNKYYYAAAPMGPLVTEFGAQALPELSSLQEFIPKDELFPPNFTKWTYHNFQADQTFNVAKVKMGDSIESFIENSQDYQADLLKTAIDFYRRKKFNGINGIFQFMFIDCWPSITWSVVDYYGKPKKGYETLKNSYQPIYISINVRQDLYFPGSKLLFDLFIINDLYKDFANISLKFHLNEEEVSSFNIQALPSNGMVFLDYKLFNYCLPGDISTGMYNMKFDLIDKNSKEKISENNFEFNVIEQP